MTSSQHAAWLRRGSPWRLARPLLALKTKLRAYGYVVYDLGNQDHLDHQPPEHHCPYSESNWPSYQGKPMPDVVTAIDIMPPGSGLPSLQQLGAQLYADRQAGYAAATFVVDMNWGPTSNRTAVRDTWRPGHSRSSSSDTGHIHLSCRSDFIDWTGADGYDPVARLRGQTTSSGGAQHMLRIGIKGGDGAVYLTNGAGRTHIGPALNAALEAGGVPIAWVDTAADLDQATLFAVVDVPAAGPVTVNLTDEQLDESVARVLERTRLTVAPTA